jgi:sulfatase modifying factor 1
MSWARWCWLLVSGVAGCNESLLGYGFQCKDDDDCASGYECSTSTSRCIRSNLSSGASDGTKEDTGHAAAGTDEFANGANATDGSGGTVGAVDATDELDGTDGTDGAGGSATLGGAEVTVSAYATCVDAGICTRPDFDGVYCNLGVKGREQHPINCVDWYQATEYCGWSGGRLPTESEWEFAATNGGTTSEPWGSGAATCSVAVMADRGEGCGANSTWAVCAKSAGNTSVGHCDLGGNVWEWTSTVSISGRVVRGGSWLNSTSQVGASGREVFALTSRRGYLGFRCIRD